MSLEVYDTVYVQRYLLVHVGRSEVGDFNYSVIGDQNVGRFNVEVEKAGKMDVC